MLEVLGDVILNWSRVWKVQVLPDYIGKLTEVRKYWVFRGHRMILRYQGDVLRRVVVW